MKVFLFFLSFFLFFFGFQTGSLYAVLAVLELELYIGQAVLELTELSQPLSPGCCKQGRSLATTLSNDIFKGYKWRARWVDAQWSLFLGVGMQMNSCSVQKLSKPSSSRLFPLETGSHAYQQSVNLLCSCAWTWPSDPPVSVSWV